MNNSKLVENGELDESMTSDPSDEISNDDFMLEYDAHMFQDQRIWLKSKKL